MQKMLERGCLSWHRLRGKEMNAEELHKELREFIGENGHKTIIQYMILRDGKIVKEGSDK